MEVGAPPGLTPGGGRINYLSTNLRINGSLQVRSVDGALRVAQTTLEAKAKNITVAIQNSGHRPVQR